MAGQTTNANVSASNITKPTEFGPTEIMWWSVAYGVVGVAVIISNVLTVTTFTRLPHSKRKCVHLLLINLSITDLLVGGVTIPLLIWQENVPPSRYILKSFLMFHWTSVLESAFSIALISIDRLDAVGRPLRHRFLAKRPYFTAILFSWLLAAVLTALMTFARILHFSHNAFILMVVASLSVPLVITSIAYTALWIIKKNLQSLQKSIRSGQSPNEDRRLFRTLFIVTVVFFATCSPYAIIRAVLRFTHVSISDHVLPFVRLLQYSNSFCNPIIYWFTDPIFATVLTKILRKSSLA